MTRKSGRAVSLAWWHIAGWTWCAPMTQDNHAPGKFSGRWGLRRRKVDYAMHAEPTQFAEILRRGFLESA